ncbi:MAG TPA: DUF1800 domain-containing protein [Steroidobacteraceae bacterium]|jgi:uncharacterized protein (DUF1800 family)|nr:DUF1800 domain-containing protein [Steroidobacteraceae bacterium]
MDKGLTSAIAANRFGLGARPEELGAIGGSGPDWLRAQLDGPAPQIAGDGLQSSASILAQIYDLRRTIRAARVSAAGTGNDGNTGAGGPSGSAAAIGAFKKLGQIIRPIYVAEAGARLRESISTDRPFVERLTQFWANHFAVSADKSVLAALAGSYEREAIRPYVLGNFNDMLLATERHPAMLLYLDNQMSMGPDSQAARSIARRNPDRKTGINENLARETMELHTVGVDGGYTQTDVTAFSQVLTGWSIAGPDSWRTGAQPGTFLYRDAMHEPGSRVLLGKRYPDTGYDQGVAVLRDLAHRPATARFIATKLARHFIADDPPAPAVARIATAFAESGGDLPTVYRALLAAPQAWEQPAAKFKTPSDFIVSAYRGLELPVRADKAPVGLFQLLGQRIWAPGSPAGWPDRSADWDGASELLKRIEWADALGQRVGPRCNAIALAPQLLGSVLSATTREAIARAASGAQAVALLLASPEFMRR